MSDFYDVFLLSKQGGLNVKVLSNAIINTANKRNSQRQLSSYNQILQEVASSSIMETAWHGFKRQSYFVVDLSWEEVIEENAILVKKTLAE